MLADHQVIEIQHGFAGRLLGAAAVVVRPECRDFVAGDEFRRGAARIVGEPGAVRGPDNVVGNQGWARHGRVLSACGVASQLAANRILSDRFTASEQLRGSDGG